MAKRGVSVGIELNGSAKGFKSAAEDAARATAELRRKANLHAKAVEQDFKLVTIAMAKVGGAVLIAKQAFDLIAATMKTTEGSSDRLEEAIGGVKEGFFEMQKALSTGNFSNFFKNLSEGVKRGKELAKALDDITDQSAYNDYLIQGLKSEQALLKEIVKNKTLELSVRADAAAKVDEIARKIQKRQEDLALKSFQIQKRSWEGRNDMETEEAIKLYETVDNLSAEQIDSMEKYVDVYKKITKNKREAIAQLYNAAGKGEGILGVSEYQMKSYATYLTLLESGEAEVLPKLFKTHKDYLQTITDAQNEYNSTLRETSTLLEKESKVIEKASVDIGRYIPGKIKGINNFIPGLDTSKLSNMPQYEYDKAHPVSTLNDDMKTTTEIVGDLEKAFEGFFQNMGSGFDNMAKSFIGAIEQMAAEMAARAAIFLILSAITGGGAGAGVLVDLFKDLGSFGGYVSGIKGGGGPGKVNVPKVPEIDINIIGTTKLSGRDMFIQWERQASLISRNT